MAERRSSKAHPGRGGHAPIVENALRPPRAFKARILPWSIRAGSLVPERNMDMRAALDRRAYTPYNACRWFSSHRGVLCAYFTSLANGWLALRPLLAEIVPASLPLAIAFSSARAYS